MTTEHIDPEHSDVEVSVAEHASVSETEPVSSSPAPASEDVGAQNGTPTTGGAINRATATAGLAPTEKDTPGGTDNVEAVGAQFIAPNVEEEVRPFTDFIEEFRQAESRFSASLQDYQRETTSSSASEEPQFSKPDAGSQSLEQAVETQPGPNMAETGAATTIHDVAPATTASPARPVSPLLRPASPRIRMPRHGGGRQREEVAVEKSASTETSGGEAQLSAPQSVPEEAQAGTTEEQPRPARRYRFDRPTAPPAASTPTGATATSPLQPRAEESVRSSTAGPVRTDNGHGTNGQTGEREIQQPSQHTKQAANTAQSVAPDVESSSGTGTGTATSPAATPGHDRRRHGQERQRGNKAQTPPTVPAPAATGTPVAETVTVVPEGAIHQATATAGLAPTPASPAGTQSIAPKEADPEDLPPLEYAELQKANTRRRRRRHPGSPASPAATTLGSIPSAALTKAVTPESPSAPVLPVLAPSVAMPRTPTPVNTAPSATQAPFTITSGYTVSQMNQSQDGSGPFMGPDPSPARGSSAAQHVRSIRTDVQRTPAYPVRTTEATSASVHQLASVVAQAIQTQTDRMVAELRRANQSPTNISVSMPPFPSNERVGVFVDVANLLYSARTLRMAVDFGKLLDFLRGNRRLIRAQAYCPTSPQAGDEQMFLQAVKGLGYRITTKNYKTFSSGAKKADLDLDLCMDVVRLVDGKAVDCIVLVSGDSDFMPMLDYCSDHGVRVEVAAFDEAMSATLRQSCDLFINLSMLDEIRA